MNDTTLLERLSRLGLPLMETSTNFDVNMTLADVVKSKDTRLWEGFPVLLVNSAKDYRFDYLRVMENLTATEERRISNHYYFCLWPFTSTTMFHISGRNSLRTNSQIRKSHRSNN